MVYSFIFNYDFAVVQIVTYPRLTAVLFYISAAPLSGTRFGAEVLDSWFCSIVTMRMVSGKII